MKKYCLWPMRRTHALLAAGLVLGGTLVSSAQSIYYMKSNYTAGAVAPYSSGGGVPAGALIGTPVVTTSNCTISWYGMKGWSTVQGSTDAGVSWVNLTNVAATNYAWSTTIPNTLGGSASFRLSQNNGYVGQATCAGCHPEQYTNWTGTAHAAAYSDPDAQANFSLVCRSVGYGQGGFVDETYTPHLENVGCENCHGPGGWHKNSDKDMIQPAISMDPAICGSCHQGSLHPTFQEWTNIITTNVALLPMGVFKGGVGHSTGDHTGLGCGHCHAANERMAMINEYYDRLAGNPRPVTKFATADQKAFGAATCATCHDPHGSTNVAQLRYPAYSTNWYCTPTVTDPTPVRITNSNGTVTTNTDLAYNTIFDSFYNPNIQVCGQCHSSRGSRWDGSSYGLVTNTAVTNIVTQGGDVNQTTYVTNTQVFTNISYSYVYQNGTSVPVTNITYTTNSYIIPYSTNQVWVAGSTNSVTNSTISMGVYYPLIPYTNNGTLYYSTNSSGDSTPHYSMQYNVLIGMADYDFTNAGVPIQRHSHAGNSENQKQCVQCHVPSYGVNVSTNVTGHTFVRDNNGCMSSCHSAYSSAALDAKVLNLKVTTSNSMDRVVSLLNQWATNVAPDILKTNFAQLAWEYPSPGALGTKSTNVVAGVTNKYVVGPYSKWNGSGGQPSGTNDNLQLAYVPQDIRAARFSIYTIYYDQSMGVHNPTYVNTLLTNAEARVLKQFTSSGYAASFGANVLKGYAPLTVQFTNYQSATSYSWNFGDGVGTAATANPSYTYNTPGLYSVTCTADGKTLTRTKYIWVAQAPTITFTADQTNVVAGTTVTFTNTSSNFGNVYYWRWYPIYNTNSSASYTTTGSTYSYTYTNAGTYTVRLRASTPVGSWTNTVAGFITVTNAP